MKLLRALADDPLLLKENVVRGRSLSTTVAAAVQLAVLCAFGWALLVLADSEASSGSAGPARLRRAVFILASVQVVLVALAAASLAAGTISGERERRTFDLLVLGRLRPGRIVGAKLAGPLIWCALLVAAGIPVLLAAFRHADVGLARLVVVELLTLCTALAVAAAAVLISARSRRSVAALGSAYAVTLVMVFGTGMVGIVGGPHRLGSLVDAPGDAHPLLFANPIYAVRASVTGDQGPTLQPWQLAVLAELLLAAACTWGAARSVAAGRAAAERAGCRLPRPQPAEGAE